MYPNARDIKSEINSLRQILISNSCEIIVFCETHLTLLKRRLWHSCFPVNFVKFLGTSFIKEHLWWLLLKIGNEELEITNGEPQKSRNGALLRDVIKHLNLEILNNKATEGK